MILTFSHQQHAAFSKDSSYHEVLSYIQIQLVSIGEKAQ